MNSPSKRLFQLPIGVLSIAVSLAGHAQSTWVHGWGYDPSTGIEDNPVCGIRGAENSPDGTVYFVSKCFPVMKGSILYKCDWVNHDTLWSHYMGSSNWFWSCHFVRATADSGCISAVNFIDGVGETSTAIIKFSKTGTIQWTDSLFVQGTGYWTRDIIQNAAGQYLAIIEGSPDSLFEYDANGTRLSSISFGPGSIERLFELPGGDLLIHTASTLYRYSATTGVVWTAPLTPYPLADYSADHVYLCYPDTANGTALVEKRSTANGGVLWSTTLNYGYVTAISCTDDDGAVLSVGRYIDPVYAQNGTAYPTNPLIGHLVKLDSLGNTVWDKAYPFPEYGLSYVRELTPGHYLASGTFYGVFLDLWSYSSNALYATLDANGNGALQTTTYIVPGDANNNNVIWYPDDLLYMAMAVGGSGPPYNPTLPSYTYGPATYGTFGPDWKGNFLNGENHKHADFDGNGVVDMADLQLFMAYAPVFSFPNPTPFKHAPRPFLFPSPELTILPAKDTVAPGDIMRFYFIAGSSANPFDSLCGLNLHVAFDKYLVDSAFFNPVHYNNTLGDTLMNYVAVTTLLAQPSISVNQYISVFCRTDQQNVYQFTDTLGYVELRANPSINSLTVFDYPLTESYGITADGTPVNFSLVAPPVVIDPSLASTSSPQQPPDIAIFPNPADEVLIIDNLPSDARISIFDILGNCIGGADEQPSGINLNTATWPDGLYVLRIQSRTGFSRYLRFVVQHE